MCPIVFGAIQVHGGHMQRLVVSLTSGHHCLMSCVLCWMSHYTDVGTLLLHAAAAVLSALFRFVLRTEVPETIDGTFNCSHENHSMDQFIH